MARCPFPDITEIRIPASPENYRGHPVLARFYFHPRPRPDDEIRRRESSKIASILLGLATWMKDHPIPKRITSLEGRPNPERPLPPFSFLMFSERLADRVIVTVVYSRTVINDSRGQELREGLADLELSVQAKGPGEPPCQRCEKVDPNWTTRRIEILVPIEIIAPEGAWRIRETRVVEKSTFTVHQAPGITTLHRFWQFVKKDGTDYGVIVDRPGTRAGLPLSQWQAFTEQTPPIARWLD